MKRNQAVLHLICSNLAASLSFATGMSGAARADEVADFYAGKTVSIVVSVDAGGLYSTFASILARHMPAHIPGRPNVIVQHMPGAGGSISVNYVYAIGARDGTVILTPTAGLHLRVALGLDKPTYDPGKFTWVGGWSEGINTVTLRKESRRSPRWARRARRKRYSARSASRPTRISCPR